MSEFRSPLAVVPTALEATPLTLTDLSALTKIQVKAPPTGAVRDAMGTPFGRTTPGRAEIGLAGTLVVGSGPGEWLVLGRADAATELRAALEELVTSVDEFATVVDLTHGRALVRLRGAESAALLAKVCAVDLGDAVTPDGSAFRSSVARVVTDVVRDDVRSDPPGEGRSYLLHCERSSGQYLAESLLDAGAEFAVAVAASDPALFDPREEHHP